MPNESAIRWKLKTRLRTLPDLEKLVGVEEGQVVGFRGVAVVAKIRDRPQPSGVLIRETTIDPIELSVDNAAPSLRLVESGA